MIRAKLLAATAALSLSSGAASASVFDFITIDFTSSSLLTASQNSAIENLFSLAENFYETRISGRIGGVTLPAIPAINPDGKVNITASIAAIDGPGNTLAQAGPTSGSNLGGTFFTTSGIMQFDESDVLGDLSSGRLEDIILHEMAHVLGFGTLWEVNGLYTPGTGQYTAPNALAAYQAECDAGATFIPIELDGGAGTANAHWDETTFGCGSSDLLTGFIGAGGSNPFSQTSLAAFEDLGYVLAAPPSTVPLPAGGVLILSALGGLAFARRRKTAA